MGLMRVLLAIAVVLEHMNGFLGTELKVLPGWLAVHVFFAISGFYMSLILTGKYRDRTTFYVNRALRLYPVYIVVLVGTWAWFALVWMYLGRMPTDPWRDAYRQMPLLAQGLIAVANVTMVGLDLPSLFHFSAEKGLLFFHYRLPDAPDGTIWVGGCRMIDQAWSIGIEIWFYLMAPFLMRLRSHWIALVALVSFAIKVAMENLDLPWYHFFPALLWLFMVGILLHRAYAATAISKVDRRVGAAVLIVVVAEFAFFDVIPKSIVVYLIYLTMIPAIPVLFGLTRKVRLDTQIGNLSYEIYIVHMLIISMAVTALRHISMGGILLHLMPVAIVAGVVGAAAVLYIFVERPIDEIRQRIAGNIEAPPAHAEHLAAVKA